MSKSDLPYFVAAEVQNILDAAARRLLAARLDGDSVGASAGSNVGPLDDGTDESTLLGEVEVVPGVDGDRHRRQRGSL